MIFLNFSYDFSSYKALGGSSRSPGESQDKRKEAQEDFQRPRGVPPSSSKALLELLSLILAFPWSPAVEITAPFLRLSY